MRPVGGAGDAFAVGGAEVEEHRKAAFADRPAPTENRSGYEGGGNFGILCPLSPLRAQERDHLAAGFSIDDEVRIQRHDFGIFMNLRHPDQAGIRQ